MITNVTREKSYDILLKEMLEEIGKNPVAEECFWIANKYWEEIKKIVRDKGFCSEAEEIEFFKVIKPSFTSYLEYFVLLSEALIAAPKAGQVAISFWEAESKRFQRFIDRNEIFIQYYTSGQTDHDKEYFTRIVSVNNNIQRMLYDLDPEFWSSHDYLVRGYLAYKRYYDYVMKRLMAISE